jgi:thiosulfate/3-mercaptopyruvate sulfurtransferase
MSILVSTSWLKQNLDAPKQRIIDCSWYLPDMKRDARAEYLAKHIPGALFFDLEDIADHASPYAHMLPPAPEFAAKVGALGIDNDTRVVVYDSNYVSARVWWMFRVHGHDNVVILNGGLTKWLQDNGSVEQGECRADAREFVAKPRPQLVASWQDVQTNLATKAAQLVDARTRERYTGEAASGYPGIPGGHIPGSINLPWNTIQDPTTKEFLPVERLRERLLAAGVNLDAPVIATCGSGVTACMLALSLHLAGHDRWKVYDGSWHKWAQRPGLPRVMAAQS